MSTHPCMQQIHFIKYLTLLLLNKRILENTNSLIYYPPKHNTKTPRSNSTTRCPNQFN